MESGGVPDSTQVLQLPREVQALADSNLELDYCNYCEGCNFPAGHKLVA